MCLPEDVLCQASGKGMVEFDGVQILPDVCPQTLARRHLLKKVTDQLIGRNILYRWRYPFALFVGGKDWMYRLTHLHQLPELFSLFLVGDC